MIERHEEVMRTTPAEKPTPAVGTEYVQSMVTDPYAGRRASVFRMQQGIYLVFGVIEGLIAIRFVLRLLGASPASGFAALIYGVTAPLIAPFVGLFVTPQFNGSAVEWHSLVAILVYALLAWVVVRVIWLMVGETRHGVSAHTTRVDTDAP